MNAMTLTTPGDSFWNSFLTGNGHIGQALTFHPGSGEITLSHIAFFSGEDDWTPAPADAPEAFRSAREAAVRRDWDAVETHVRRYMGRKGNYGTSLPVGTLRMTQDFPAGWTDYRRSLDLTNGVASCSFRHDGALQAQQAFCSHPDKLFCLQAEDEHPQGASLRISVCGPNIRCQACGNELRFTAQALETVHSDGQCGVKLSGRVRVEAEGGDLLPDGDGLLLRGVHRWRILLNMDADFDGPLSEPALPTADWAALLRRHTEDFSARMNRVGLEIPGQEAVCRMVALGRYLLLSGAREDSPLPMSLQGVWNDNVACNIGWTCDMHLDVNTQMNYWLSGVGALPESRPALFRWLEERLIPHGRRTAREHYGMPGWAAEVVANAWGWAQPYWHPNLSPCPGCGAWEAADYMEHYRYTGDSDFLRLHALPVLAEAAEFFLAYLFEQDGQLIGGPSISPESLFLDENGTARPAAIGGAFETASIRQLFTDLLEARSALGLPPDERVSDALRRLPEARIAPDGTLAEWSHDLPPADPQHRHMSHLIGLYPYGQITPEHTDLAAAAQESIRRRLDPYDNWEDTGWARTMLTMYAARLRDGEQTGFHLSEMLRILTTENGLVMHPSTRGASSFAPVWELDGNTGFAAAALEALLQSHNQVIRLLPALPPAWPRGRFEGLIARGNVRVDAAWDEGRLLRATLTSPVEQRVCVAYGDHQTTVTLLPGAPLTLLGSSLQPA